jgi:N12 class adenine-specific DNA methylase
MSVKQLEKMRDRIKAKIEALADRKQDDLLNFDELGVDALSRGRGARVQEPVFHHHDAGRGRPGQPRGQHPRLRYVREDAARDAENDGRGVYFATGTPVSNSIAETFHMQRYLQFDDLKERGIHNFDAWASTFGQAVSDWEMDAAGRYKQKTRFSKFANLGELRTLWRSVTDIVTRRT